MLVLLATTLGPPELAAQMLPDGAPVMDFKLHGFGEDGYKIWELQGSQGHLVSEDLIEVIGMRLRLFSGGAGLRSDFIMESPVADMRLSANTAEGEHGIRISSDHFLVEGAHWQWRQDVRRIRIERGVRVTFREKLEDILR